MTAPVNQSRSALPAPHTAFVEASTAEPTPLGTSAAGAAVWMLDPSGRIISWSAAAQQLIGLTAREVIGQHFSRMTGGENGGSAQRLLDVALRAGSAEFSGIVNRTGIPTAALTTITPLLNREQHPTGFACVTQAAPSADIAPPIVSDALFRALVEHGFEGFNLLDAQASLIYSSPGNQRLLGYSPEEANGRNGFAFAHPDDLVRAGKTWKQAIENPRQVFTTRLRVRHKDGTWRWTENTVRNLLDVPGVRGIVVNWRDVSQQHLAELELQRTVEMLKAVADGTTDAVFVKDLQGKYMLFNEAAGRFVGRPPADVLGRDDTELFDPESARLVMDRDRRVMETGQVETQEEVLTAAGVTRVYQATKAPYRDASGKTIGLIGISRDITASQQARAALLASEERYRSLVDLAPEGIGILQDGRLVYANQAGARMMQAARPEDLIGLDLNAALHPDDREISAQRQAAVLATGRAVPLHEVQLRRLDGQFIDVETCAGPCTFDGRPAIQIVARDITARKQAEAAFRDSEERYRRLVELLPDAVYVNCQNRIVFCNPALLRLLGAKENGQVLGRSPYEIFAPAVHSIITERNKRMLAEGVPAPLIEEELLRLDGKSVTVHVAAAPITYQGQPAILVVLHDLSELRRSEELLRSVLRSVNDAIITVNEQGAIEAVNPAAEKLFDYAAPELIGQPISLLMTPLQDGLRPNYVAEFVRTGVPRVIGMGREVDAQRKDGTAFPAELSVTEFRFNDARHFTGVVRDLTERKRLEEQVRQAQKMEAIGRLAGGVAHDFNNLLTVILGFSDLLLNEQDSIAGQRDSLLAIRAAGERAAALTKQLLAFGRKALIEPKIIDLNDTVVQIDKMLRRLIGENIVLSLRLESALPPVKVDPSQIEQVLMNLVVNARDAMPQGGRLTITTQAATVENGTNCSGLPPGTYARLTVSDTGHGITSEMQQRIFDPFYTTKEAGTGLGLAVVHGIVKQSGGQIEVESQLGVGTSFHVLLPVAAGPLPPPGADVEHPPEERGTESILLVEDEDAVRTIAALALESRGYRVVTAASGHQALSLIGEQRFRPELIVTDVVMPGLSGPQLAAVLQSHIPRLRVLYLSGYTDDAVVRHGLAGSDAGFLAKPYTARALAHKVREILNRTSQTS